MDVWLENLVEAGS